ncbi:hypothetical protein P879_02596 [Paragonimus westermani]|uniref:Uncharacterized protein n=1 Tax=Paragonimus westermani TaxID=34504 RepID=A0A8T0DX16_9TREM|nr:hypothetical protein P879_02596 [Paragonimus westermani]
MANWQAFRNVAPTIRRRACNRVDSKRDAGTHTARPPATTHQVSNGVDPQAETLDSGLAVESTPLFQPFSNAIPTLSPTGKGGEREDQTPTGGTTTDSSTPTIYTPKRSDYSEYFFSAIDWLNTIVLSESSKTTPFADEASRMELIRSPVIAPSAITDVSPTISPTARLSQAVELPSSDCSPSYPQPYNPAHQSISPQSPWSESPELFITNLHTTMQTPAAPSRFVDNYKSALR